MLTNAKVLKGFKLNAVDGEVGSIKEFFFDDKYWTIRYLVVNAGGFLNRREVLISPYFLQRVNYDAELIDVNLTRSEIENSPTVDEDKPISRQFEEDYYNYYGAPSYWSGPYMWGVDPNLNRDKGRWKDVTSQERSWDPHLESSKDVMGHTIQATDDELGSVDDYVIDDENWAIRYFIVDTKRWLPGKKVLISPQWIDRINWEDKKVAVNLSRESIEQAPEFDEDDVLTREYESNLHKYYNRKGYWLEEPITSDWKSTTHDWKSGNI